MCRRRACFVRLLDRCLKFVSIDRQFYLPSDRIQSLASHGGGRFRGVTGGGQAPHVHHDRPSASARQPEDVQFLGREMFLSLCGEFSEEDFGQARGDLCETVC